jgi:hypothetical protein
MGTKLGSDQIKNISTDQLGRELLKYVINYCRW